MRVTMLAASTRGDVQPYVALGVGLQRAGHHVCIPAPEIFRGLIVEAGLDFKPIKLEQSGLEVPSPQELLGQLLDGSEATQFKCATLQIGQFAL